MRKVLMWLVTICFASPALAQIWQEPARGTPARSDLMDAVRPLVEWQLGEPVQFVVNDLRVSGSVAFASMFPQRPGGGAIDPGTTPAFLRGHLDPTQIDGLAIQVLYRRSGQTWVAVHWAIGATDVWYAYSEICAMYRPVIPEACQGL